MYTSQRVEKNMKLDSGTVRGEHLVPRMCSMLGVRGVITVAAKHAAKVAGDLDLVGGLMPQSVAAAAILLVCSCCSSGTWRERDGHEEEDEDGEGGEGEEEMPTLAEVAEAAGVSRKVVGRPYQAMYQQRESLLTEEFVKNVMPKGRTLADVPSAV